MNKVLKMDEIDKQIIHLVQEQPYITYYQIASKINRSQPNIGKRIKRLKETGFLQLRAGLNIKATMDEMYFAIVTLKTNNLDEIHYFVKQCPLILNAFSIFGSLDVIVLLAGFTLEELDKIVNYYFRNKQYIKKITVEIISDVICDFILPLNLNLKNCDCDLKGDCIVHQ